MCEMIIGGTPHNIFVHSIVIYDSPDMFPNMKKYIVSFRLCTFVVWIMFRVTKLHKVTKFSRVFNSCIIEEGPDGIPHHV